MTNASSLESFVSTIRKLYQQLTASKQSSSSYLEILNSINLNIEALNENPSNLLDNVLPLFTLPEYTLPNMAVLYSIVSQIQQAQMINNQQQQQQQQTGSLQNAAFSNSLLNVDSDRLLNQIEACIELADDVQVEISSEIYSELCHFYAKKLCIQNTPKRGLTKIRAAIAKLQRDPVNLGQIKSNLLTTVHSDLFQLSLASKNFSIALDFLSKDILDIHRGSSNNQSSSLASTIFNASAASSTTSLPVTVGQPSSLTTNSYFDSKYLLSYFYYAGCIYGALKQFDQSLFYLEQALTVPASQISQVMVEAYKKFLLMSLISKGKLPSLPKYTSRIVVNQIKPMCSMYHEIAAAFMSYDIDRLNNLIVKYQDTLNQDRNYGLIKQLQHSFFKKNIQMLTKTFITLSLADMALKVKLPSAKQAEIYMLNMIKDGEIFATINQKDGMVSFHDNPEKYDNPVIMEHLTKQMFECIQMDANIKEMDKEIATHPHYIQKCLNNSVVSGDDSSDQIIQTATSGLSRQQSSSNFI